MTRKVKPTERQREILDLGVDTIRVAAGAGTGKTTTVAMVIAGLVRDHDIHPEQILGITFTNKAASELADRVRTYLGGEIDPGSEVEVHTYHGFAGQILSEFGLFAGLDRRPDVITPTFARQLLSETFNNTDYETIDNTWPGRLQRIKQLGDRLGDHLLQPTDVSGALHGSEDPWPQRDEMLTTLEAFQADKRELSVVDYSDLITMSTQLVRTNTLVAEAVQSRYRVVVLDEYQDTNPAQRILLTTIFGDRFPVIAVGDPDQTIYEWRGASAENFNQFGLHFSRPDGSTPQTVELTDNYRSGQRILDVANEIRRQANPDAANLTSSTDDGGTIETHWAGDSLAEAEWIARRFEILHDSGTSWSNMAVLFRKNKDFPIVVEALARHDIPFEVANLGGLLSVPEVSELRAWMTVLDRPGSSSGALQILTGSRYRLGLADIAPVSRWVASKSDPHREDEVAMTLIEAIEELDDIPGLSDSARSRYGHFIGLYRQLLTEMQGSSLVEIARLILDQTRSWSDIESLPPTPRLTARLNVYRFLDLAEDWSPIRGKSSLAAFLDYLTAMEEEPAEELDAARLSGEDAVSLVTVHRAKGLEWDVVAVPAVTAGNFPGKSSLHPDPDRHPDILPIQFRIDNRYGDLPSDPKERRRYFQAANLEQEWRVAYVAATRARQHLMVSGAYWYGHPETNKEPKEPSPLFTLVHSHPNSTSTGAAELPERPNAIGSYASRSAPDPIFSGGWAEALSETIEEKEVVNDLANERGFVEAHRKGVDMWTERLFALPGDDDTQSTDTERSVSVTGLVTYAGCPKQFFWSEVDRLPRRRNPAAVRGTEVHRRIEMFQKGHIPFEPVAEEVYDVPDNEAGHGAYKNFMDSRFAKNPAARVEAPFTLALSQQFQLRGRIDAIYEDQGSWEVVDFKSGTKRNDEALVVQLECYAVACHEVDFGIGPVKSLAVTFAYLGGSLEEETHEVDADWLDSARAHLAELREGIESESFPATPSLRCGTCDFVQFCEAGTAYLSQTQDSQG